MSTLGSLLAGGIACAIGLYTGIAISASNRQVLIDRLQIELSATETRANYLYRGVANRGYVELCKNSDGKIGVWFADECVR